MDERAFFSTRTTVANVAQTTWGAQRCQKHAGAQAACAVKQGKRTSMPNSETTHSAVCLSKEQAAVFLCGQRRSGAGRETAPKWRKEYDAF
jgi:hypothetical protein